MTTFDRLPGDISRCANCGRLEREHTWRCDGCGRPLAWPSFQRMPALHVSLFPEFHPISSGATLFCEHEGSN